MRSAESELRTTDYWTTDHGTTDHRPQDYRTTDYRLLTEDGGKSGEGQDQSTGDERRSFRQLARFPLHSANQSVYAPEAARLLAEEEILPLSPPA